MSIVEEQILNASDIIVNNAIQKAGYDKTIQAQVISCEDATIGKYKCRHQDSTFYAYSNNTDLTYTNGAYVYIHVPGNDMSKQKTILGTTNKLGINYISQAIGDQAYNIVGNNCISLKEENNVFNLYTNQEKYSKIIYKIKENEEDEEINEINLDKEALKQSIQQSSSLIIGATIKTSIEPQRQSSRGHYGITYTLKFLNNNSNEPIIRSYTIDEDNMIGNPYRLVYPTRQYQIFDIDGPNFVQVVSIQIFNENFPNPNPENKDKADIEITKLQLNGAIRMSESELSGVAISFYTPQGLFFTESSEDGDYKKITAQVRIKGKLASAAQKIPFYWGKEHIGITSKNVKYNKYLGRGWQCLNNSNVITQKDEDNNIDPVVQWVPGGDTYIVEYEKSLPKNNRFKVAIVYDNNVISKQINIQNLAPSAPEVTLESSEGTQFYFDSGETVLSCIVTQQDKTSEEKKIQNDGENAKNFTYYWGYVDPNGAFFQLENTEKTYNVKISDISLFRNYKCSVYKNPTEENADFVYLGTAQITISNSLQAEGLYHLAIENGDMVFQYNENGIAPTSKSLDSPQTLKKLSFTLYDNTGHPIDAKTIIESKDCEVTWEFPIGNDTLLIDKNGAVDNPTEKEYRYYKKIEELTYDIAPQYNIKKQRNQIKLTVNYKGMIISKETAFIFVKQGQPGTNGTQYIVRIVPDNENPPIYPMITKVNTNNFNFNFSYSKDSQPFKVQLWKSGERVWDGYSERNGKSYNDFDEKLITKITWDVLKSKLQENSLSLFTIKNGQEGYSLEINNDELDNDKLDDFLNKEYANIIKCSITIKDKTYYGTLPIITAWVRNEGYVAKLKDYSGFRYVIYTSDGIKPQYDSSSPFEFLFEGPKGIIDNKTIKYEVGVIGNLLTPVRRDNYKNNQYDYQPASRYNGESVIEAVTCKYIYQNEQGENNIVAMIHVPIHFLLNKYGLSYLNDWDGNSIEINNDGGYILSPQMGAGSKKGSDNAFTGVLMGEVKTPGKNNPDIGLLGYAGGARTFFLNSQTGSAIFGKTGKGQIIIDPSTVDRGLIYSGNFWKDEFYNSSTGLPNFSYSHDEFYKNYRNDKFVPNENNTQKSGLLIDLTAPEIYFGTGNFYVTNQGCLHAAGGGDIAGWNLSDTELTGEDLHLVSSGKIYSNSHEGLINTDEGFYLSADGLSIGSKVKITKDGTAYFGTYAVQNGGVQGKNLSRLYWTIDGNNDNSYIAYGGQAFYDANQNVTNDKPSTVAKVYLGTNGISLGKNFSVNTDGSLTANYGLIGGWQIKNGSLIAGIKSNNGTFTDENIRLKLNSNGSIQGGNSYKWSISQSGEANFNRIFAEGSGSIAGWTITANGLSSSTGNMKINKDGSMSGGTDPKNPNNSGWTITSNGVATFANTFNVNSTFYFNGTGYFGSGSRGSGGGSLTGGGTSFGSGGLAMDSGTTTIGGENVQGIFNSITADIATINTLTSKVITTDNLYSKIADMRTVSIKNLIVNNRNVDARFKSIENSINRIWDAIHNLKPSP